MKVCSACEVLLPLSDFGSNSKHKDGLQYKCKKCINEHARKYRAANKERLNRISSEWRKANKEKIKLYGKKHRELHAQKYIIKRRNYRQENLGRLKEYNESYRKQNLDKARNREHARRSRKLQNGTFLILDKEIKRIYNSSCFYCGSRKEIHMDHIVPISKGGTHSIGNLLPACKKCNQSKASKFLIQWKSQKENK